MCAAELNVAEGVVEALDVAVPCEAAAVTFGRRRDPAILETTLPRGPHARFSIFACEPADVVEIADGFDGCPLEALFDRTDRYPPIRPVQDQPLPFVGGAWIGFLSYEAGLTIERVPGSPRNDAPVPWMRFGLYDSAAVYDHEKRQWYVTAVDWPRDCDIYWHRPPARDRLAALRRLLEEAALAPGREPPEVSSEWHSDSILDAGDFPSGSRESDSGRLEFDSPDTTCGVLGLHATPNMSRREYFAKVERAKRYIEAGDIYQVNLSRRWTTTTDLDPLSLYLRLRRSNPATHAALLSGNDWAILSASPELFLQLHDGQVITRPIKGTRRRGHNPEEDTALRRELFDNPKDTAELTMIIDLLRNDLGRVCLPGTIRVLSACDIEEHPTVFHRVATIAGRLAPRHRRVDLLRATLPGGSVTGAPKIRAMQIITELEPTRRGVYCGCIGWLGLEGSLHLNLAIRTMFQKGKQVHVHAGGAIIADSEPEAEYEETLVKAKGMFAALAPHEETSRAPRAEAVTS